MYYNKLLQRLGFGLSAEVWVVQVGVFLNYLGWGAVMPFEVIYLHDGRGFSLGFAGLVVGVVTGLAVLAAPVAGTVIDRVGARVTAAGAGVALAAGYCGLAVAHTPRQALVAALTAGIGNGALLPSQSALLASLAPQELRQVFLNLLVNALDAIEQTGRVRVTTRQAGDEVVAEVRDDGCGMTPDVLERIFDPFFTTKRVGEGTGLGLGIAWHIVHAHGGRIEVESAPGAGTTFRVHLPVDARPA